MVVKLENHPEEACVVVGLPFHCSWWLGKAGFFYRGMKQDFISGLSAGPTRGPGAATKAFSSPWRGLGKVECYLPAHRLCLEVSAPLGLHHHHLGALAPAGGNLSVGISSSRFILIITTEASFIPHFSDYLSCLPCFLTSLCSAATSSHAPSLCAGGSSLCGIFSSRCCTPPLYFSDASFSRGLTFVNLF